MGSVFSFLGARAHARGLALALVIGLIGAGQALADPTPLLSPPGCADTHACVWGQDNFNGDRVELGRSYSGNDWSRLPDQVNGGIGQSAKNRLGTNRGFGIANGPPGNRTWSDCIGNNSQRATTDGRGFAWVVVKTGPC